MPFTWTAMRAGGSHVGRALLALAAAWTALACSGPRPLVPVGDIDADGRLTGADLEQALEDCRPGCHLLLDEGVWEDVALVLGPGFPEGLVLQGAGPQRTLLRAPVPAPGPVLKVDGGPLGLVIQDLGIDGRKSEQPDSVDPMDSIGIYVASRSRTPTPWGRIENLEVAHLMTAGILLRDAPAWTVTRNLVHDIGCHTDIPCPGLLEAGEDPHVEGRQRSGHGIYLVGPGSSGTTVRENHVWRVTKIGIEAFTNHTEETPPNGFVADFVFAANTVHYALGAGIIVNNTHGGRIEGNVVDVSGGSGVNGSGGAGIGCAGVSSPLAIRDNYVHSNQGPGLRLACDGDDLLVERNLLEHNCTRGEVGYAEIDVRGAPQRSTGLVMHDNEVDSETDCSYGLLLTRWEDVEIEGGSVRGGRLAGAILLDSAEITLSQIWLSSPQQPGLHIESNVSAVHLGPGVVVQGLVDPGGALGAR